MNMPIKEKLKEIDIHTVCREEIRECDKHDLIVEISRMIDSENPAALCKAEKIFDEMKYSIAHYIMKHEFGPAYYSNQDICFQLEEKAHPGAVEELNSVINKYLL